MKKQQKCRLCYYSEIKWSLYTAFLHSIKLSGYKTGIKYDKNHLGVVQKNTLTKIVNVYIVYDLDAWPKIVLRNFIPISFFVWSKVNTKNIEKSVYSGYKIAFDGKGQLSFGDYYARSVIIFCVDNN